MRVLQNSQSINIVNPNNNKSHLKPAKHSFECGGSTFHVDEKYQCIKLIG